MSIRYDENTKARAVRLVRERNRDDYDSEWAMAIEKAISGRLGMDPETLRKWVRRGAEIDADEAPGVSSEARRSARARRKCRELESTKSSRPQQVSLRGSATRDTASAIDDERGVAEPAGTGRS